MASTAESQSPQTIVEGVSAIVSGGWPGPIYIEDPAWWPLVGSTTASQPSLFAAVRTWHKGRVAAFGHDGILVNSLLDTGLFRLNMVEWLGDGMPTTVHYTTGHGEWLGPGNLTQLSQQLAAVNSTLSPLAAPITPNSLQDVSVLIVGNAWGALADAEIEAIHEWVAAGGGLAMPGLGWSWRAYHPSQTMEDYPMMRVAAPFGIRWLDGSISDPKNNIAGSAIFDLFYPNVPNRTVAASIAILQYAHLVHGAGLAVALEDDPDLRREFVLAHQLLAVPVRTFPPDHPERAIVATAFRQLLTAHGEFLARDFAFDRVLTPTAAWLRERFWRTLLEAEDLDAEGLEALIAAGGIDEARGSLLYDYRLLLMDNVSLDGPQVATIRGHLDAIAPSLHDLRVISAVDLLGNPSEPVLLAGRDGGVNIFSVPVGAATENQFPSDSPPGIADLFSVVVAHEVTHSVDAFGIGGDQQLRERRDALIVRAGTDSMNYLRSMIPDGFFVAAPQEFVASIANQWFTDTPLTIALGVSRFAGGRPEPLNQVLFMVEVFSTGGSTTPLYTTSLDGLLTTTPGPLLRDPADRIVAVRLPEMVHRFELDEAGWVVGHWVSPPCPADLDSDDLVTGADLGLLLSAWGHRGNPVPADLDRNGAVDGADLGLLLAAWGPCP
jgi:hypothetical protein